MARTDYEKVARPIIGLGLSIALLIMLQRDPRVVFSQWFWSKTQGVALSLGTDRNSVATSGGGNAVQYSADLRYRFSITGKDYVGDRYGFMVSPVFEQSTLRRIGDEVRTTKSVAVEVYFDPGDPQRSYGYITGLPYSHVFGAI
jgi:hypothetical protein